MSLNPPANLVAAEVETLAWRLIKQGKRAETRPLKGALVRGVNQKIEVLKSIWKYNNFFEYLIYKAIIMKNLPNLIISMKKICEENYFFFS